MSSLQAKIAKSSSWRVWLGSWRSGGGGTGRNGKPGSGSLDAAVAAAAAAAHPRSPAAQQVSRATLTHCLLELKLEEEAAWLLPMQPDSFS